MRDLKLTMNDVLNAFRHCRNSELVRLEGFLMLEIDRACAFSCPASGWILRDLSFPEMTEITIKSISILIRAARSRGQRHKGFNRRIG
jgi:hypothetical protein